MSYKPFSKPNKNLKDYCHNINTFEKRLKGLKENISLIISYKKQQRISTYMLSQYIQKKIDNLFDINDSIRCQ